MPNVMFKRGPHANLANTTLTDGCFYLTTDTDRLFVATKKTQNGDPVHMDVISGQQGHNSRPVRAIISGQS